jgi:hypothetical protein
VNALTDPKLGKYLDENFVSAFQKVGTFRIVGQQKQGGNVASYFCAQDGRVLHVVAGPVNAQTLLREARWVVETVKSSIEASKKSGKSFKAQFREAHAERLRKDHGLTVQPVTFDTPAPGEKSALSYRDPSGNTLAPKLPPPPIEGPDVSFSAKEAAAFAAKHDAALKNAAESQLVKCRAGRCFVLGNQGRVHMLLAAHAMKKIETVYGSVFEGILGEKVSTKPVIVATPFPWVRPAVREIEDLKLQPTSF